MFGTKIAAHGQNGRSKVQRTCLYFSRSRLCQSNLSEHGCDNKHNIVHRRIIQYTRRYPRCRYIKPPEHNAYEKCSSASTLLSNFLSR